MIKINIKKLVDSKFKNINQFALAMNLATLNAKKLYEGESTRISLDVLERLCSVLNCTPNDIFYFDDFSNKKSNYAASTDPISSEDHVYRYYKIDTSQIKDLDDYFDRKIDEKLKNLNVNISTKKDSEK